MVTEFTGLKQSKTLIGRVNKIIVILERYDRHSNMNAKEIISRIPVETINFYYAKVVLHK